jgi:hypothetical protein
MTKDLFSAKTALAPIVAGANDTSLSLDRLGLARLDVDQRVAH